VEKNGDGGINTNAARGNFIEAVNLSLTEVKNGEWRMENGEWRMENGEWRMENGKWRLESGE